MGDRGRGALADRGSDWSHLAPLRGVLSAAEEILRVQLELCGAAAVSLSAAAMRGGVGTALRNTTAEEGEAGETAAAAAATGLDWTARGSGRGGRARRRDQLERLRDYDSVDHLRHRLPDVSHGHRRRRAGRATSSNAQGEL